MIWVSSKALPRFVLINPMPPVMGIENREVQVRLGGRFVPSFYFGHDFLDCGAFQPSVAVAGVVASARSIRRRKRARPSSPSSRCRIARVCRSKSSSLIFRQGSWYLPLVPGYRAACAELVGASHGAANHVVVGCQEYAAWPCSAHAGCRASNGSNPSESVTLRLCIFSAHAGKSQLSMGIRSVAWSRSSGTMQLNWRYQ